MSLQPNVGNFDRLLSAITQRFGDPTFSILKAHLIFEEVLRTYLERNLPNAKALSGARLSFAQILGMVRSLQPPELDDWQWEAVAKLNSLRNQFSHHLAPSERDAKIDAYVSFVTAGFGRPLPPPEASLASPPESGGPYYQAIDIANAGLFGSITVRLGFRDGEPPET